MCPYRSRIAKARSNILERIEVRSANDRLRCIRHQKDERGPRDRLAALVCLVCLAVVACLMWLAALLPWDDFYVRLRAKSWDDFNRRNEKRASRLREASEMIAKILPDIELEFIDELGRNRISSIAFDDRVSDKVNDEPDRERIREMKTEEKASSSILFFTRPRDEETEA